VINNDAGKLLVWQNVINFPLRNEKAASHNVAVHFASSLHPQCMGQISPFPS